jgi:hypothetical protein
MKRTKEKLGAPTSWIEASNIRQKKSPATRAKVSSRPADKKRVPGRLKGKIFAPPSAFAPMTKRELKEWGLM